ncbi:endonuclease [Gordonia sp. CNJ-863]|uniref:endonuclease/exonuclease/phosphatase family protein n=1 Tax=Gordonia TaxID=2053 RepID=UPI00095E378A|nr:MULTISPECIES: endonuclease/exonuclease/phosphatase family protein [Gordonia]AZZ83968.1 endonuclease/exonuclease/phosphatase family protein [Gordonia alkanivorans]OLT43644.1 endonuclease [Gordonia sp. CNJ-863]
MIGRMRGLLRALGWGAVLAAAAGVAAHYSGLVSNLVSRVAAFTPVLIIVGVLGLLLLLAARAWLSAAGAVLVIAVGVTAQVPLYRGVDEQVSDSDLTVMQANIYLGQADPDALVSRVRDSGVDALTIVELTPEAVGALERAGLRQALPFAFLRPRDGGGGAGIYARAPLTDGQLLRGFELSNLRARLLLPNRSPISIYALHPLPPYPEPSWRWDAELRELRSILFADTDPLIIGADANSTYDHRSFRQLLSGPSNSPQLTDAAEHLGSGVVATYPAGRPYPSLLALDRVLTRNGPTPTSFRRIDLPGSDHHGVLASIRLSEG